MQTHSEAIGTNGTGPEWDDSRPDLPLFKGVEDLADRDLVGVGRSPKPAPCEKGEAVYNELPLLLGQKLRSLWLVGQQEVQ